MNPDHLKMLQKGVDVWNAWILKSSSVRTDLSGANLSRANLWGANFGFKANLSRANLSGANLYAGKLYGANLSGAKLTQANLVGADLTPGFTHQRSKVERYAKSGSFRASSALRKAGRVARIGGTGAITSDLSRLDAIRTQIGRPRASRRLSAAMVTLSRSRDLDRGFLLGARGRSPI